jgi:signal transduction histidine kinase
MLQSYPLPFNEHSRQEAVDSLNWIVPQEEPILNDIVATVRTVMGVPTALVSIVDNKRQWFAARDNFPLPETSRDYSLCAHAIMDIEPLVIPDTLADPVFRSHPVVVNDPHIRFYVGAPIVLSSGLRVGSLCAIDYVPHEAPSPEALKVLTQLARVVASTLERIAPADSPTPSSDDLADGRRKLLTLIGHELRTPLTSILGFNKLLANRLDGPEGHMALAAAKAAEHLADMLNSVMHFADLSNGDVLLNDQYCDLRALLADASAVMLPVFQQCEKNLHAEIDEASARVKIDGSHIKAALSCLLMNAAVHGGTNTVLSTHSTRNGDLVVEIFDDGTGLPDGGVATLMPFTVGEDLDTRTTGGIGLGLPLAQCLAELHGGRLSLVTMGNGMKVSLILPAWRVMRDDQRDRLRTAC